MYGPEIINYMVLKYVGMSSSDQIPIHEKLCLRPKVPRFSNGYIGLGIKMCTLVTTVGYIAQLPFV